MYITPNTNVRLLKNIRLDLDHTHSISWEGKTSTDMYNYFASKTKYNLANYSYQKHSKDAIKVAINCDMLYDCNYMMFQNSAYGNKWFYAFITDVEYINDNTSAVYYKIDVIQTWYFETWFEPCFVEREHTRTDKIGDNIQPEPVATGEYVFNKDYYPVVNMKDMVVCIAIVDVEGKSNGSLYDGIYGGCELFVYDSTDTQTINAKINEYTQKPESIIGMYMFPLILINEIPKNHKLTYGAKASKTTKTFPAVQTSWTLNGYLPKNNKMYTYPYNYLSIDNASGEELALRYEFFDDLKPALEISGTITQPVSVCLRPVSYKGVSSYDELGGYTSINTESISLNNYPLCSWNVDAYQAWVSQNAVPLVVDSVASLATATLSSGFMPLAGVSTVYQVANIAKQFYNASIASDICKGKVANGGVNVANNKQQFYGGRLSVNKDNAKTIDDYFTMFGYAVNRLKTPSTWNRENYTYIKTIGSQIEGNIPQKDLQEMNDIHDNGITYWRNGDVVGDYSVRNNPRG